MHRPRPQTSTNQSALRSSGQIDALVYELYELTPAEIAHIENA